MTCPSILQSIDKGIVCDFGPFRTYVKFAGTSIPQNCSHMLRRIEVIVVGATI